jgi:cytochrome b561
MKTIIEHIKRVWFECFLLIITGAFLYWSQNLNEPVFRLFTFKVLLFSASQLHAHIVRQLVFPYVNFRTCGASLRWIVVAIHVAAAYLYAQGG